MSSVFKLLGIIAISLSLAALVKGAVEAQVSPNVSSEYCPHCGKLLSEKPMPEKPDDVKRVGLPPGFSIVSDGSGNYKWKKAPYGVTSIIEYRTINEATEKAWAFHDYLNDSRKWEAVK